MGIKVTGADLVKQMLLKEAEKVVNQTIDSLNWVGLKTVSAIRTGEASNWDDQSGNLRSSVGFIVTVDGKIVRSSGFDAVRTESREGSERGRSFAAEIAKRYPKGFALIVVAGMEYAAYVEAIEGKSVLAGGELFARREMEKELAKIGRKIAR